MLRRLLPLLPLAACAQRLGSPDARADKDAPLAWQGVLQRSLRGDRVDYAYIEEHRGILHRYLRWVGSTGPELGHWKESAEDRRIAFNLNAFNAAVIEGVLRNWPLASVRDVEIGLFRYPPGTGFFFGQKLLVDGEWVSLWYFEHQYTIDRYQEPLVHAALNRASLGSPPLRWWEEEELQEQLETAMSGWLATDGALRRDGDGWAANELFALYEDDFLDWSHAGNLCQWMAAYSEGERYAWLDVHADDCPLRTFPFDWTLNALALPARED